MQRLDSNLCMQRDSTQKHVKSLDVVLGADTSVLILDDTEGVWPGHTANLIQVDRYIFFPACVARFGRKHKSLLETGEDEDPSRGMLAIALRVMQQVHSSVFQAGPTHLRSVNLPIEVSCQLSACLLQTPARYRQM